jgi:DNA-binding NtrC family response regulator
LIVIPPAAEATSPQQQFPTVLVVEPDAAQRELLVDVASAYADADGVANFQAAFDRLGDTTPDLLVACLRLRANVEGLQLAYVVASAGYATRAIVYSDYADTWVAHEIQRAGAFFETPSRLLFALPSYIHAKLPVLDRRNPQAPDRRMSFRGGRRASDVPTIRPRL